jgi:hypothetical protein
MGGVSTVLRIVPSEKLAVVVLCNSRTQAPGKVADEIMKIMLKKWSPRQATPPLEHPIPREAAVTWKGRLVTYQGELPFELDVKDWGEATARIGNQKPARVKNPRWEEGYLTGRFQSDIQTEDANRRPYDLLLTLKLRGNVLNGAVTAVSQPGKRPGNALTSWAELGK